MARTVWECWGFSIQGPTQQPLQQIIKRPLVPLAVSGGTEEICTSRVLKVIIKKYKFVTEMLSMCVCYYDSQLRKLINSTQTLNIFLSHPVWLFRFKPKAHTHTHLPSCFHHPPPSSDSHWSSFISISSPLYYASRFRFFPPLRIESKTDRPSKMLMKDKFTTR